MTNQAGAPHTAKDESGPPLHILLLGVGPDVDVLKLRLQNIPSVNKVKSFNHMHHAWGEIFGGRVNTVFIDCASTPYDEIGAIMQSVFRMRETYPEIVFVFVDEEEDFKARTDGLLPKIKLRLDHYYKLGRLYDNNDVLQVMEKCVLWHKTIVSNRAYTAQYKYDVALSFAGEQRGYAEGLAEILNVNGVRVFYDNFERAELWDNNLFEYLYKVYSKESRYCIVFVSKEYADKMWAVYERHSAQERVLLDRNSDYLLPIKVDDTKLPGLPATIAYLDLDEGIPSIASLFLRKIGGKVLGFVVP